MMRFLAFVCFTLSSSFAIAQNPLTLTQDGKSQYTIVIRAKAGLSEKRGAGELQTFIEKISGAKLPIADDAADLPPKAILVGFTRHTIQLARDIDPAKLGPEGFAFKTAGPHLLIAGSEVRGAMYGCTALLEHLGVRFYTPTVTRCPKQPNLTVPFNPDPQVSLPLFEYREPYCTEAFEKEWAAHLMMNGNAQRLDDSTGGKIRYSHFVHTFDDLIPRSLFAAHPEYFPVIKGKRTDGYLQRCLSNPEVLKLAKETVLAWIEKDPRAMIYSVSQNDCAKWCECDNCKKITDQYGAHSGLYLWFVNQVAEEVEKKHPDKLIDTLAYQFTEPAPRGIVPRKNVRVRLCPIACCYAHPFDKCAFPATVKFMDALRAWSKITDTLYIWHYNTNFANYLMPFPNFDEFPESIELYRKSGVKGIFFEGCYAPGGGGSFAELQAYVMARMMWGHAGVPASMLVRQWHDGVFGRAASPMLEWYELLHAKARVADKHFGIYSPPTIHYLSADVIAKGDELFDQAEKLAAGDDTAQYYVAKARLGLRYVKLMQKHDVGPALDAFLADVKKFKIGQLREGQALDAWEKQYRSRK